MDTLNPPGTKPLYIATLADIGLPGGRTALFTGNTGGHSGNIQVALVSKTAQRSRYPAGGSRPQNLSKKATTLLPAASWKRIPNMGQPRRVDIEILGQDQDLGAAYAKRVLGKLRALQDANRRPLLTDLQLSRGKISELHPGRPRKGGVLGISAAAGPTVGARFTGGQPYTVSADSLHGPTRPGTVLCKRPHERPTQRDEVDDIRDIFLRTPQKGRWWRCRLWRRSSEASGPVQIGRNLAASD